MSASRKNNPSTPNLENMPDDIIEDMISPYLNKTEQNKMTLINRGTGAFFQKQTAANRVLDLVVNYKLTDAELENQKKKPLTKESITNPILIAIDTLLETDPSLALMKGPITDPSGRTRINSPLQYAYWSGNFIVCKMILEKIYRIKPNLGTLAVAEINEVQNKAENYDLSEYTRNLATFFQRYPTGLSVNRTQWEECDADALRLIDATEKRFPAWIAQLLCSDIPLNPVPTDFSNVIQSANSTQLKYKGRGFYDPTTSNHLPRSGALVLCGEGSREGGVRRLEVREETEKKAKAITALCEQMSVEFKKINQLLLNKEIESRVKRSP